MPCTTCQSSHSSINTETSSEHKQNKKRNKTLSIAHTLSHDRKYGSFVRCSVITVSVIQKAKLFVFYSWRRFFNLDKNLGGFQPLFIEYTLRNACAKHLPLGFMHSSCYPLMLHAHICFLYIKDPYFLWYLPVQLSLSGRWSI